MIRPYVPDDAAALATVFYRSIRERAVAYTPQQRAAWAPIVPPLVQWQARLAALTVFVADPDGANQSGPTGFLAMDGSYLDFAFVLPEPPELRGSGVAAQLYDAAFEWACTQGFARLTCAASYPLRSFLLRRDWQVDTAQTVSRLGVKIPNFRMSLTISAP